MNDETFNSLIDVYTFPAMTMDVEDWPTEDLVTLSLKIDAELQRRADDLDGFETIEEEFGEI